MKFSRASFKNFRLLRDLDLDFSTDSRKPLTVFRAENETGKTTILNGLQWILFGDEGLPSRGTAYRIIPIDWDVSRSKTAEIAGELEFEHIYERPDKKGGWVESRSTYLARRTATEEILGPAGWRRYDESFQLFQKSDRGWDPVRGGELPLRQMLGTNLKDLFFTDSDRALSFITSEVPVGEKRRMVQKAIRDMLGFEILENSRSHVQKALAQIRGQVKEFGGASELSILGEEIQKLVDEEGENEKRLSELDSELKQIAADSAMIEQKLIRALEKGNKEELANQKQKKEVELNKARADLESLKHEHGELFRKDALPLQLLQLRIRKASEILEDLKAKGRIPRTAIPILRERLELGECICGSSLKPGSPGNRHLCDLIIQQEAASVVDDRLTELRLTARQRLSQMSEPASWTKQVALLTERRNQLEKQIGSLEAEIKALETKISELPETDVAFLNEQRKKLLELRDERTREQGRRLSDRDRLTRKKNEANERWERLTARQKQFRRVQCKLDAASDILGVIALSYKQIENNEVPRVRAAMNDYFLEMIEADPENAIIRKADITDAYDIAVYGPLSRNLDPDIDLNGASRRALTLAFILALTEVSGVKAPNVIDTPLGMMSGMVKRSVLSTAIAHTHQLVLFLTRDEINGCQDLIDKHADTVLTLTSSAHYPKQLVNAPEKPFKTVLRCDCNHHQYCRICERVGDKANSNLSRRQSRK